MELTGLDVTQPASRADLQSVFPGTALPPESDHAARYEAGCSDGTKKGFYNYDAEMKAVVAA